MTSSPLPDLLAHPARVALLEGCGAGLGGVLRSRPEDFLVEEIPLYRPTGTGRHTIAQIEKRGTPTFDALLFLSKAVKVSERVIGYAGLKDSRAIARQYVSLPKVPPERLIGLRHRKFRVLSAVAHEKALKIGHLAGNRFTIRIREPDLSRVEAARAALETLVRRGMPNAYGGQRFGVRQDGHLMGRALLHEDWQTLIEHLLGRPRPEEMNPKIVQARQAFDAGRLQDAFDLFPMKHRNEKRATAALLRGGTPRDAFEAVGKGPRKIWLSAWQSYLFNEVLDRRIREGTQDRLLEGDVAWLHESGAMYRVRDEAAERGRAQRLEASPTGPLMGFEPERAEGRPGRLEREILDEAGADEDAFRAGHGKARGLRRPLRVPVREASLDVEKDGSAVLRFVLPPGSFATVLLRHLMAGPDGVGNAE